MLARRSSITASTISTTANAEVIVAWPEGKACVPWWATTACHSGRSRSTSSLSSRNAAYDAATTSTTYAAARRWLRDQSRTASTSE